MPVTNYIWDEVNDTLLMEKDEAGNTTAAYTYEPGQYGPLISRRGSGQTNYYHFDEQGSTRQLTDANQNVTDSAVYTAFGETVACSGTTTNPFGYKGALGYYANPETADVYVRARPYEPLIARWLSHAPMVLRFRGINGYAYASWNHGYASGAIEIPGKAHFNPAEMGFRLVSAGVGYASGERHAIPTGIAFVADLKWGPATDEHSEEGVRDSRYLQLDLLAGPADKKQIAAEPQCPERCCDGELVLLVPIWNCTRKLAGVIKMGPLKHGYVCCDAANKTCLGIQKYKPSCWNVCIRDHPTDYCENLCYARKGDQIEPEIDPTGVCTMRCVTPQEKQAACNGPRMPWDYSVPKWHHCYAWADDVTTTKCKG